MPPCSLTVVLYEVVQYFSMLKIHPHLLEGTAGHRQVEHCVWMGLTFVGLLLGPLAPELCCTLPDC